MSNLSVFLRIIIPIIILGMIVTAIVSVTARVGINDVALMT
jgi:hypothetical protein